MSRYISNWPGLSHIAVKIKTIYQEKTARNLIERKYEKRKSAPQSLLLSLTQVFYLSLWFDWQLRTHVGALWGAAVGWWPVPVTPATMVTRPTVLGSYWPNLETPSLSSLQTSRQRRSMTTWKWRDLSHQPSGESLHSFFFFPPYVSVAVIVSLRNMIAWTLQQHCAFISARRNNLCFKAISELKWRDESQFIVELQRVRDAFPGAGDVQLSRWWKWK